MTPSPKLVLLVLHLALLQVAGADAADPWPARTITIVAPSAPGGTSDIVARLLAEGLTRELGKPVVVENRPGAGTNVGNHAVARAAPDGYTLLIGMTTLAINPHLYKDLPYDPLRDFRPVRLLGRMQNVVVVGATSPIRSVNDLVAEARARPGQLNYASGGAGTSMHLSAELFKSMTSTDLMHVPYKSSALSVAAVATGDAQVAFENMPIVLSQLKGGRVRAIAVTGRNRSQDLPDLPTVAEAGIAGYEVSGWFGLVAPAGTDADIVRKLDAATLRYLSAPETRDRLRALGAEPAQEGSDEFAAWIRAESTKWGAVARKANIRAD